MGDTQSRKGLKTHPKPIVSVRSACETSLLQLLVSTIKVLDSRNLHSVETVNAHYNTDISTSLSFSATTWFLKHSLEKQPLPRLSSITTYPSINGPEDVQKPNSYCPQKNSHPTIIFNANDSPIPQWRYSRHRCSKRQWSSRCPGHSCCYRPLVERPPSAMNSMERAEVVLTGNLITGLVVRARRPEDRLGLALAGTASVAVAAADGALLG